MSERAFATGHAQPAFCHTFSPKRNQSRLYATRRPAIAVMVLQAPVSSDPVTGTGRLARIPTMCATPSRGGVAQLPSVREV